MWNANQRSAVKIPSAVGSAPFTLQFLLKLSKIYVLAAFTATQIHEPSQSETLDIMILLKVCQAQDIIFPGFLPKKLEQ